MEITEEAEEILEILWIHTQEKGEAAYLKDLTSPKRGRALEELQELHLITREGGQIRLTEEGLREARNVVRRQRLAERLLADVLEIKGNLVEEVACRFEHVLAEGVDESICTLLGHPKFCPHGSSIPPGKCCLEDKDRVERVVAPLSKMEPGAGGKIAYIRTGRPKELQKLMAMGILPGVSIKLLQRFPSYVFQIGQTQVAVDERVAKDIYVRLVYGSAKGGPHRFHRRIHW